MFNSNSNKKIDPTKTVQPNERTNEIAPYEEAFGEVIDIMQQDMRHFLEKLLPSRCSFEVEDSFGSLLTYVKSYDRLLYSTVSNFVYELLNGSDPNSSFLEQEPFDVFLHNFESLVAYANKEQVVLERWTEIGDTNSIEQVKDTCKAVWKLWDHINLARRQYDTLKLSNSEYDTKFEERIVRFKSELSAQLNSQLISMVGIFTALAFVLFGGISSLSNVLSGLKESHVLLLLIIGCGWGLGMLNVTFVFLFCVGKMTKLSFKSTYDVNASFWQRYPVVVWTDFLLLSVLILLVWLYFCVNRGMVSILDRWIYSSPLIIPAVGFVIIIIVIVFGCWRLIVKTRRTTGREDE